MKTKIIIFSIIAISLFAFGVSKSLAQDAEQYLDSDGSYNSAGDYSSATYYDNPEGGAYTDTTPTYTGNEGTYTDTTPTYTGNEGSQATDTNVSSAADSSGCFQTCKARSDAPSDVDCNGECNSAAANSTNSASSICSSDSDCAEGYTCSGWFTKTCEKKATTAIGTTAKETTVTDKATGQKVTVPAGCTINTDGSVDCNGSQVASAGSVDTGGYSSSDTSGLTLCANGMIGTTCSGSTTGTPLISSVGTSYSTGTSLFSSGSVAGSYGAGCGAGFSSIAGVCFPTSTGLSSASMYTILSNLLSWLMALFTIFAVMAFLISGIQYFTSAGDMDQVETAKRNATYALLGVIIGLSGYVIIQAISTALSGGSYLF
jgi:hypothetical protein